MFAVEATAAPPDHYADVRTIALPYSGIQVESSSLYWQNSDPRDVRQAIYPDVEVPFTWVEFVIGGDAVLGAIAALAPDDPRLGRERPSVFNWMRASQRMP